MANSISLQPMLTTNALGSFSTQSEGLVQGNVYDDPAVRFFLTTGYVASTEVNPMWGGIAITENITTSAPPAIGNSIARATAVTNITGFTTYNQGNAYIITPQSEAPSASGGMTIPYYRFGSGARVTVACDPSLVSLGGGAINQQVSWDFNNERLQPYDAATATVSVTSITATFNSTTGVWDFAVVAAAPTLVGAVGDAINISGVTSTGGTASIATLNTNQIVTSFTDNQHFSFQITAVAGSYGTIAGTIVLNQGTGALPVKILEFNFGNSMIIDYDPINNLVHWNRSGSAAVILI